MYKLYYSPGACSMAIHALLNELGQKVEILKRDSVADFLKINPTNSVPVLDDEGTVIKEGGAQAIYLMEKHGMMPKDLKEKANVLYWTMFANATLHPAYSKMFFVNKAIEDAAAKEQGMKAGVAGIEKFWNVVDAQLAKTKFVTGDKVSAADFMFAVYANWNGYFPVEIKMPANVKRLLKEVSAMPSFQKAVKDEQVEYKAAA